MDEEPLETIEDYEGFTIEIYNDSFSCQCEDTSPRCWDGNITKIIAPDYNLGDEHHFILNDDDWDDLKAQIMKTNRVFIVKPLHFADYGSSGHRITIDKDVGKQVGFIFADHKLIKKHMGMLFGPPEVWKERIEQMLLSELSTYEQWFNGNLCGFQIKDTKENVVESCWGFYTIAEAIKDAKDLVPTNDPEYNYDTMLRVKLSELTCKHSGCSGLLTLIKHLPDNEMVYQCKMCKKYHLITE